MSAERSHGKGRADRDRTDKSSELSHAPTKATIHAEPGMGRIGSSSSPHGTAVVGLFRREADAESAVRSLRDGGMTDERISIIAHDNRGGDAGRGAEIDGERDDDFGLVFDAPAITAGAGLNHENYSDGIWTPAAVGGIGGLLASTGLLTVPGFGQILAAGPLAGVITNTVGGTVGGGLLTLGVPDDRTRHYESRVKQGYILAVVHADDRQAVETAARVMRDHGAEDVEVHEQSHA